MIRSPEELRRRLAAEDERELRAFVASIAWRMAASVSAARRMGWVDGERAHDTTPPETSRNPVSSGDVNGSCCPRDPDPLVSDFGDPRV